MSIIIGVTGTGSLIGQGIIKSILGCDRPEQYKIIGFDYFADTVGSFWCDKHFKLPDLLKPSISEDMWVDVLMNHIFEERINILFVGVDFELPILSINREKIEKNTGCSVVVSNPKVIDIANDKYTTYCFLKDNGFSHPQTWLPHSFPFESAKYPLIVKPRVGARSVGVYIVKDEDDLKDKLIKVNDPIIQEYLSDVNAEYTCGVICFNGQVVHSIALKRTLKAGHTHVAEHIEELDESILSYIKGIAQVLRPHGSCNFQLRIDKDGAPKLFEINPRNSGTTFMRSLFGYNEIMYCVEYLVNGNKIEFDLEYGKALRFYQEQRI
jgi:carbamoyl-phosphate synthase large subunit